MQQFYKVMSHFVALLYTYASLDSCKYGVGMRVSADLPVTASSTVRSAASLHSFLAMLYSCSPCTIWILIQWVAYLNSQHVRTLYGNCPLITYVIHRELPVRKWL